MDETKTEALLRRLRPPFVATDDHEEILNLVPELRLSRGVEQSPYHHLDTLGHVFEVVERTGNELSERVVGAEIPDGERRDALLLAALLHDVAKPVTRGEIRGRVVFVAHDTVGAILARSVCLQLGVSALQADAIITLTALHLKIGFMRHERTDYPPERLIEAAGPFAEELAVLSWADRMAAQGPKLTEEHIRNHRDLCRDFLEASRASGPHPDPDYEAVRKAVQGSAQENAFKGDLPEAEVGYLAGKARLVAARGIPTEEALSLVAESSRQG
ncbi:MAG: HD domain-containing protein [Rubrobacter sp.]